MNVPMMIGGDELRRHKAKLGSPFYEGYQYQVAQLGRLELGSAIQCAHHAAVPDLAARSAALRRAAESFRFEDEDVEHAVRMTGMPVTQVRKAFEDIPRWLMAVPDLLEGRFRRFGAGGQRDKEWINPTLAKLFTTPDGFCYAALSGNDPRLSALVAANLGYRGIPFILRASNKDATAPLVIRALLAGGFDPSFCSLVYFEMDEGIDAHFKLLRSCRMFWTDAPQDIIEQDLRFEAGRTRVVIDSPAVGQEPDPSWLAEQVTLHKYRVEAALRDRFEGKQVIRQESGRCAAVTSGPFTDELQSFLYESIAFPTSSATTKSIVSIEGGDMETRIAEWLRSLVVGDPIDPQTQIGYINPADLDALEALVEKNQTLIKVYGGERLSACQSRPLLVASEEGFPDLFGQDIPAYVLELRTGASLDEAVERLNRSAGNKPRLAVAFYKLPVEALEGAFVTVRAHAVMVDQPTTRVVPIFHAGSDYAQLLGDSKLVIYA